VLVAGALAVLAGAAAGCKPDLGSPASLLIGPRVLAVRGIPAEAPPGSMVAFDGLAADPTGTIADPRLSWSFCETPKPPAETNAVSVPCLTTPDDAGPAATFMAVLPGDGCMKFGPDSPGGMPPIRPRDPDVTGGFYQPLRVTLQITGGAAADVAFELQRITCLIANAPIDITRTFNMTYTANQNPSIDHVTLDPDHAGTTVFGAGSVPGGAPVAAGTKMTLELAWPAAAAESYPVWDLASRTLATHRESLRVSWFASAGTFALDNTGRGEEEPETFARNDWTAPTAPGNVHFWVVLRDARGGLDFGAFDLTVAP
jgi:hypothetical protein